MLMILLIIYCMWKLGQYFLITLSIVSVSTYAVHGKPVYILYIYIYIHVYVLQISKELFFLV